METTLRGYALAVLENAAVDRSSSGLPAVASDLRQISDVSAKTPVLAQAITDEMIPKSARRLVFQDLFSDKVVAPALRIVSRAAWVEHADGLLSVLGELAELAIQIVDLGAVQFEAEEHLLGRVGARKLASGYA